MSCNNCARHVREAIETVSGVRNASINLEAKRAVIHWSPGARPKTDSIIKAVEQAGYQARLVDPTVASPEEDHCKHQLAAWQLNLWVGVGVTLPLMLGEWLFGLAEVPWFRWFSFAAAAVVQAIGGAPFYRGAWNQLRSGRSNMDSLVA